MYHKTDFLFFHDFDEWWSSHEGKYSEFGINKKEFQNFPLDNGFNKGDILFIIKAKPEKLKIGDMIIFEGGRENPLIHRIIKIEKTEEGYLFSTIGDNNNAQLSSETSINEDQLVGKAVFKITPYLGWGKLVFFEHKKTVGERGFCRQN